MIMSSSFCLLFFFISWYLYNTLRSLNTTRDTWLHTTFLLKNMNCISITLWLSRSIMQQPRRALKTTGKTYKYVVCVDTSEDIFRFSQHVILFSDIRRNVVLMIFDIIKCNKINRTIKNNNTKKYNNRKIKKKINV